MRVAQAGRRRLDCMSRGMLLSAILALVLGVGGCAGPVAQREALELIGAGRYEEGLRRLEAVQRARPDDADLRRQYLSQREMIVRRLLRESEAAVDARDFEGARKRLERAASIDPHAEQARRALAGLGGAVRDARSIVEAQTALQARDYAKAHALASAVLTRSPANRRAAAIARRAAIQQRSVSNESSSSGPRLRAAFDKPVSLSFQAATIVQVFEALKLASGINFVFDHGVRRDAAVTLSIREKPLREVLKAILESQQLASKAIDGDTLFVYPDTPEKRRQHQEYVVRSFYLANANATSVMAALRNIVRIRDVFIDERLNAVVVRDTPTVVALAGRLVANLDVAEAEVMLELEVLEVSTNRLTELGIRFPDSVGFSVRGAGGAGQLTLPEYQNRSSSLVTLQFSDPLAIINLKRSVGDVNLLANPRVRIRNRGSAKVLVGERVPVITTTTTANVGTSESVTYLDVGLKLEIEPVISLDDEVSMNMALEVSNIVGTVTRSSGLQAFRLGTRNASTVLKVRDGETQVLGGLIQSDVRRSGTGVPGLADIPFIGRLFSSSSDNATKTEVILLVTPRIVRNIELPPVDQLEFRAGTDAELGARQGAMPGGGGTGGPASIYRPMSSVPGRSTFGGAGAGVASPNRPLQSPSLIPSPPGSMLINGGRP